MALETGTYISDLNSANPVGSDSLGAADDHLRLIKSLILATFPNITGAVTPTHTELNYVDGVTSALEWANKYVTDSGAANAYVVTLSPTPASYTGGMPIIFRAANTNTGASTVNANSLGVKNLKMQDNTDLQAGYIVAGAIVVGYYDDTDDVVKVVSQNANNPTLTGTDVNVKITSADTTTGYLSTKIPGIPVNNAGGNETLGVEEYAFFASGF